MSTFRPLCTPQRWNSDFQFVKSSRAITPAYAFVSIVSKSAGVPTNPADFIQRNVNYELPVDYNLKLFDSSNIDVKEIDHIAAEEIMRTYVSKALGVKVVGTGLKLLPMVETIPTSAQKIPDGTINFEEATVFVMELISNKDSSSTLLKLSVHLCQMLASLRNRKPVVKSLSGFYFPWKEEECVVEVVIEWSDTYMLFIERHKYLAFNEVADRLKLVYSENLFHWKSSPWPQGKEFVLSYPATPSYVSEAFEGGYQIQSGHSVVIVSPQKNSAYKRVMSSKDERSLVHLLHGKHNYNFTEHQIEFPRSMLLVGGACFFVYKLFLPPLISFTGIEEWYVLQVVKLLTILHGQGLAHLDVRLENICFDETTTSLVLIDLDRSAPVTKQAIGLYLKYPAESYKCSNKDWTVEQLDWKQCGILFERLFPSLKSHCFITELKEDGKNALIQN